MAFQLFIKYHRHAAPTTRRYPFLRCSTLEPRRSCLCFASLNQIFVGRTCVTAVGKMKDEEERRKSLKGIPTFLLCTKFIFATTYRALYPLVSIISLRYDSIETENVAQILAAMQFFCMLGCFLAPTLQMYFRIPNIICMCLLFEACLALVLAFSSAFHTLATAIVLLGVSKGFLFPSIVSFVNTLYSEKEQGVTIGYIEIAWGLSSLIGMPFVGITMNIDFRLPFFILAFICISLSIFGIWFLSKFNINNDVTAATTVNNNSRKDNNDNINIKSVSIELAASTLESKNNAVTEDVDKQKMDHGNSNDSGNKTRKNIYQYLCLLYKCIYCIYNTPLAFSIVITTATLMMCMYVMFLSFGVWLVQSHNYNAAQVGGATLIIGVADLLAEFSLIKILKHVEHVKFLLISNICLIFAYLFLAFSWQLGNSVVVGLCAIFLCFYFFELIIVGQIGIIGNAKLKYVNGDDDSDTFFGKGLLPAAVFLSSSTGSIIGSLLGPILWNLGQSSPGILGFCGTVINFSVWIFYYKYHHHHNVNHVEKIASQSV